MRKLLLALAVMLAPLSAYGQSVQQSGTVVPKHAAAWTTNGVIQDAGTASNPNITTFGVVNNGGQGICVDTGLTTAAGYQQLCLSASLNGAAVISLQNYGTATPQNLEFLINGTIITIPTGAGSTIPTITTPLVNGNIICASGTTGALVGCTTGTNGQIFVGQTSGIPLWKTLSGDVSVVSAAGAVTIGGVNGVTYPASPSTGTAPYVSSTNTITYGQIPVSGGGTGVATLTTGGVLVANGTSPITSVTTPSIGLCLLSNGTSVAPSWGGCASGSGSAAGANTQVQFNNASALAGSANLTWVSPALTIGVNATATGQLVLANGGALGTSITIQNNANTSAYNFNLPISAGSAGQPMISGGGGSSAMQFSTLGIIGGGTNCTAASGTCLDNITGFSSNGFINRTGPSTYTFTQQIGLANGGTGANLTASNGGIFYSTASAGAILSGTATANQALLSGSSAAPAWSTATYPPTTTINQVLYSSSANTITGLATGNNGVLITSSGGVPSISSTLPAAVQANITATGTIASGTWQGSVIALAFGGTNANLTASNGGIHYSTASATAILAGTATASLPLLSGSTAAPTWAAITYPSSASSGGVAYFSSTTAMASSGTLTANQIMVGGGSGAAPTTFACATTTTVVHGGTPPTCSQIVNGDITTATIANSSLAVAADSTIKSNISGGSASPSDNTITAVLDKQFGTTQGTVVYRNATVWAALTPGTNGQFLTSGGPAANVTWASGGAGTGTVTSITPGSGLVSSVASSCSQTAISAAGTLYSAECTNAQTGTSYAIVDGDRAKLVTASNAAAQAYTLAQAGNASAFQTGWYVDINNISTNVAGIVTITPTTSTINGTSTYVIPPGSSARIISDGTNYQIATHSIAATKSDQQTGTSQAVVVTPLHQQDHASAVKAWASWVGATTGTNAPTVGYNVTSVTRNSTGNYTVNFTTNMATGNYVCTGMVTRAATSGSGTSMGVVGTPAVSSINVDTRDNTNTVQDVGMAYIECLGAQ